MWLRTLQLGLRNLLLHKLRSVLTMLGTILGVASVIAMLSIGEGSKQHALEQIRSLGAANVIIRSLKPQEDNQSTDNSSTANATTTQQVSRVLEYGLLYDDLGRLSESIPGIKLAVPISLVRKNAQFGKHRVTNARILGTTPDYLKVKNLSVDRGRFISDTDLDITANVAVIGAGAARRLFGFEDPLGKPLLLGSGAYRVVGVLETQDSGNASTAAIGLKDFNQDIYIPITATRRRFGDLQTIYRSGSRIRERTELSEITLTVEEERLVRPTADMANSILETSHPKKDYEIQVPLELLRQAQREKRIWNIVLGSIAGISLVVGGIGIMNIMLATVTERTREIGIRRALGAKRHDIVVQFLVETLVISIAGGIFGIFLGVLIPFLVTYSSEIATATRLWTIAAAFGISVGIGIVFGVYPARRAAMLDPIEALRHQ